MDPNQPQQPYQVPQSGQQPYAPAQPIAQYQDAVSQAFNTPAPTGYTTATAQQAPIATQQTQPTAYAPAPPPYVPPATVQQPSYQPSNQPQYAYPPNTQYAQPMPQAAQPYGQAPISAPTQVAPPIKSNPNSTQNTLQIAEIRDGVVIMSDGSYRCVVMVKSINFDLMSPQEREAVEYSYQGFLNSLYFPIQIFIRSQRVDLRPYLERLDKIRSEHDNMLLALLMEDYLVFMDNLSAQTNIMDKKFYIVIPFFPAPDIQKAITQSKDFFSGLTSMLKNKEQHVTINEPDLAAAKDELRNRVQSVLSGLQQCGVQGLPLDTQELIELYYDTYNPDTATRQQLKNFDDLTAPIVTKGQGVANQPNLDKELR